MKTKNIDNPRDIGIIIRFYDRMRHGEISRSEAVSRSLREMDADDFSREDVACTLSVIEGIFKNENCNLCSAAQVPLHLCRLYETDRAAFDAIVQ